MADMKKVYDDLIIINLYIFLITSILIIFLAKTFKYFFYDFELIVASFFSSI